MESAALLRLMHRWAEDELRSDPSMARPKRHLLDTVCGVMQNDAGPAVSDVRTVLRSLMACARVLAMSPRDLFSFLGTLRNGNGDCAKVAEDATHFKSSCWIEQLAVKLCLRRIRSGSDAALLPLRQELLCELPALCHLSGRTPLATRDEAHSPQSTNCTATRPSYVIEEQADGVEGRMLLGRPLAAFSEFIRVPKSELFNITTVSQYSWLGARLNSPPWRASFGSGSDGDETILLLSYCYEYFVVGASKSHWGELLRRCPSSFPHVPTNWPLSSLLELEGTSLLDEVVEKKKRLQSFVSELAPLMHAMLPDDPSIVSTVTSPENLQFARAAFDSRAFWLNYGGGCEMLTMAPRADMLNHAIHTDVLTRRIDDVTGDFVLEIGDALGEECVGSEVFMSYGPLQNWELLLSYGFVLDDNENDVLPFPLESLEVSYEGSDAHGDADAGWASLQREIEERFSLRCTASPYIPCSGQPPPALLALLRLRLVQDENDLLRLQQGPFSPLSAAHEQLVVDTVEAVVNAVLASFPTTLEEDESTLVDLKSLQGDEATDANYLHAVVFRISLKRIGRKTLEWCSSRRAQL